MSGASDCDDPLWTGSITDVYLGPTLLSDGMDDLPLLANDGPHLLAILTNQRTVFMELTNQKTVFMELTNQRTVFMGLTNQKTVFINQSELTLPVVRHLRVRLTLGTSPGNWNSLITAVF